MPSFKYSRPSLRAVVALVVFILLAYLTGKSEKFILPMIVDFLQSTWHLNFRPIFGQKPAVTVNRLTTIVIFRSVCVLLITWIALKIERRPWRAVGYSRVGALRHYGIGLLVSFLAISALMMLMWLSHVLIFDGQQLHGSDTVTSGLRWLVGLLMVGIAEECAYRGYALVSIARVFGAVPAVLITSCIFAAGHAGNPGETFLGLLQVFLFGAVLALSVFRTGSLWWAVAFHGMWNWAQESFYGTLGSGYWFDGHLFQFRPQGSGILSGTSVGPEGSAYCLLVLGALLAYELVWRCRHPQGGTLELPDS